MTEVEGINALPNEILLRIFDKLEVIDRLRAQLTCQRWMRVGKMIDHRYRNNVIFSNEPDLCTSGVSEPSDWSQVIEEVGWGFHSIEFSPLSKPPMGVMQAIARNCPRLRIMNLPNDITPDDITVLAQGCHKLEQVCIRSTTTGCDDELAILFRANPYLNYLLIDRNSKINGSCLKSLAEGNRRIKQIRIIGCPMIRRHLEVLRDLELREFTLSGCVDGPTFLRAAQEYNQDELNAFINMDDCEKPLVHVSQAGESLISLRIQYYNCLSDLKFDRIGQLTGLIVLEFQENIMQNDSVFEIIATNCLRLRAINLIRCYAIGDNGMNRLLGLPQLRVFKLDVRGYKEFAGDLWDYLDFNLDGVPELLPNLVQFQLNGTWVPETRLLSFIERAPNLRSIELDPFMCNGCEDEFLEEVAEARIRNGASEAELTLIMSEWNYIDRELKYPNLYLLDSNLQLPRDRAQYHKIMKEIRDNLFFDLEEDKRPDFPSF